MKSHIIAAAIGIVMAAGSGQAASAQSNWSLEFTSPLWTCLIECAGVPATDALATCLEVCGEGYDSQPLAARAAADELRCKSALMRAEAAQFSCHSRCLSLSDSADLSRCVESCNDRYDTKVDLILATPRCAGVRTAQ